MSDHPNSEFMSNLDMEFGFSFAEDWEWAQSCILDQPQAESWPEDLAPVSQFNDGLHAPPPQPPVVVDVYDQSFFHCRNPNSPPAVRVATSEAVFPAKSPPTGNHGQSPVKKRKRWSEEEHTLFLLGLEKYGKGDWKNVSRHCVTTRSPSQIASHAQKHFLRQSNNDSTTTARKKRKLSFNDITTSAVQESQCLNNGDGCSDFVSQLPFDYRSIIC